MVRGLELFKDYFKDYQDQYVLIGGSATFLNLSHTFKKTPTSSKTKLW